MDFGCGTKPYEKNFKTKKYIGLDIEESGRTEKYADIYYNGQKIPFENNYFDAIFSSEVFEHIFNLEDIMKELNRILKIRGKILITLPFAWEEHEIPYDYARYTSFGIKYLLEKNGFRIIQAEKSGNFIEVIVQYINTYIYQYIFKYRFLKRILTPIIIGPINIAGIILSNILPKNLNLYHNNIIIAEKIKDV